MTLTCASQRCIQPTLRRGLPRITGAFQNLIPAEERGLLEGCGAWERQPCRFRRTKGKQIPFVSIFRLCQGLCLPVVFRDADPRPSEVMTPRYVLATEARPGRVGAVGRGAGWWGLVPRRTPSPLSAHAQTPAA